MITFKEYMKKNPEAYDTTELVLNYQNITTLSGIEEYTCLKILCIAGNYIKNLKPLRHLTNLKELYAIDNKIENIEPLKNLDLETLSLSDNKISNIDIIYFMKNLKKLHLVNNNLDPIFKKYNLYHDWIEYEELKEFKNILKIEHRKKLISMLS